MVYEAMLRLNRSGRSIDLLSLKHDLEPQNLLDQIGGLPFIAELIEQPTAAYLDTHVQILMELHRRRQMIRSTEDALSAAERGEGSAAIASELTQTLDRVVARVSGSGQPILLAAADVAPESVEPLWAPYILRGKFHLLEGDPGLGKTQLALAICAAVTRGCELPGAVLGRAENVLYMTGEDGIGDTLRPRLEALGADLDRAIFLEGKSDSRGRSEPVSLSDLEPIERAFQQVEPALLVIDPLQAFLGAGVDMHRANEVRPVLHQLGRLAQRYGCAIIAVRHLRKAVADRAVHRGLGSVDIAAYARSILVVGEDPSDPKRRIVAHAKQNLDCKGQALGFRISNSGVLEWDGESSLTADDLLAPRKQPREPQHQRGTEWLVERLLRGPTAVTELKQDAAAEGISWRTLERAKADLGALSLKTAMTGGWCWALPEDRQAPPI